MKVKEWIALAKWIKEQKIIAEHMSNPIPKHIQKNDPNTMLRIRENLYHYKSLERNIVLLLENLPSGIDEDENITIKLERDNLNNGSNGDNKPGINETNPE